MQQFIKDAAGPGTGLWLLGYLASLVLFFSPYAPMTDCILIAFFTPVTVAFTWYWFRAMDRPLSYYVEIGAAWTAIAIVLD